MSHRESIHYDRMRSNVLGEANHNSHNNNNPTPTINHTSPAKNATLSESNLKKMNDDHSAGHDRNRGSLASDTSTSSKFKKSMLSFKRMFGKSEESTESSSFLETRSTFSKASSTNQSMMLDAENEMDRFCSLLSTALFIHTTMSEQILASVFFSLKFEFEAAPTMECPACSTPLTRREASLGWSKDPNSYVTVCIHCASSFVPRFQVYYERKKEKNNQEGKEGGDSEIPSMRATGTKVTHTRYNSDGSIRSVSTKSSNSRESSPRAEEGANGSFFPSGQHHQGEEAAIEEEEDDVEEVREVVELLSPWVLRKQLMTLCGREGAHSPLLPDFYESSPALFWNLILLFRSLSLPHALLLCYAAPPSSILLPPPPMP